MSETPTPRVFQKGFLPADITRHNSNVAEEVNVLRFPLGDGDNFSVSRACHALVRQKGGMSRDIAWLVAPWEKQYLGALAQVSFKAMGDSVSGVDGGYLAPEVWGDRFFGLLRSFSVFSGEQGRGLPVTRVNVPARVAHFPKVTNDLTAYYPGENTAITTSSFQFGQISYTAHKSTALVNVSNEMMGDAPEMTDQILRSEGARFVSWDRDTQLLTGTGGSNPVGMIGQSAAGGSISKYYPGASASTDLATSAAHATPSYYHVSSLRSKVTALNGSTSYVAGQAKCTGIVAHSRFEKTVNILTGAAGAWTDGQGRPIVIGGLEADGGVVGVPRWPLTNILPTNSTDGGGSASSFMIAGWWEQYVLFECLALGFDATQEGAGFASNQTQVRLVHRYDGSPIVPQAFAVLAGCDQ